MGSIDKADLIRISCIFAKLKVQGSRRTKRSYYGYDKLE